MNPNEIRLQMAMLDGYPPSCKLNIEAKPSEPDENGDVFDPSCLVPDYLNDLNAVARVVAKLHFEVRYNYRIWLHAHLGIMPEDRIDATALQRCEAILRACGKWVDG